MSSYVFSLSDVSVADGSQTVTVNNSDSFFGLIEGSQIFIAGKLPATIIEHDTGARTLTLSANWAQGDVNNASAQVVPIGAVATLLTALENNRSAYNALTEAINNPAAELQPIVEDALRYINTQVAQSPPVKQSQSLTHVLSDYPTLKKTIDVPTYSPNNKRKMLFDDVRQSAYIALTDDWLKVPNVIATRDFLLTTKNRRFIFEANYTGDITLRVYPMGSGGSGIPTTPTLANYQWHTVTVFVTGLPQFGGDFVGLVDFIQTDTGFETLSAARSRFSSVGIYYGDSDGNVAENHFIPFSLRQDGHWYSADVMPETPHSMGGSWTQDVSNKRLFFVDNADGSSDALRLFPDSWDDYEFEIVVVTSVSNPMALTIGNNPENTTFFEGTYRFIIEQERIYFKRRSGTSPIDGNVLIESLRLRVKHYE